MNDKDLRKNSEGYPDPTAYEAIKRVEAAEEEARVKKLLKTIFTVCDLAGFRVDGRIALEDLKTGKIWR